MLNLIPQRNASKFAVLLEYENLCSLFFCVSFSLGEKKLHEMKNNKKLHGFLYSKSMANFEMFLWGIKLRINLLFLKGA